ncbi:hypothetical protein RRG08_064699 [Elysia crispata]|uniref:Uncharacterized protein n=1 Tax=Elysia crispata TaxID=231223 RepID=A0AAE0Z0I5_9GAST|nr:hypothetical protein RRG08_064699 [Elysia crispata]
MRRALVVTKDGGQFDVRRRGAKLKRCGRSPQDGDGKSVPLRGHPTVISVYTKHWLFKQLCDRPTRYIANLNRSLAMLALLSNLGYRTAPLFPPNRKENRNNSQISRSAEIPAACIDPSADLDGLDFYPPPPTAPTLVYFVSISSRCVLSAGGEHKGKSGIKKRSERDYEVSVRLAQSLVPLQSFIIDRLHVERLWEVSCFHMNLTRRSKHVPRVTVVKSRL